MLQKFRDSTGRWITVGILGLIAVTFIFFGVDFSATGSTFAAKVNGENVPLLEFERELQQTQNQYQQLYPVELTDDLRRELRRSVIERMVLAEALEQRAEEAGYRASNERLREAIRTTEAFRVGGEFSVEAYTARLSANGMSPAGYEELQRSQLELLDLQNGIAASTFVTPDEFRRYVELFNERREVGYALFEASAFLGDAEISDEEVAAHYEQNSARYMSPESVDIEYVRLDREELAAGIEVTDEALREYYEEERQRFETAEERRARHILIEVEGDDYEAAEAEAQSVLARLEAGEEFAAVAQEVSDDAGTAAQGGDLGWIGRGVLEGAFEDALYGMEIGEVTGPVETEFGYHIIRLDEVRAGDVRPFEQVRDELEAEYQTQRSEDLYFDAASRLDELAFDAYDELASVATEMDLPLQTIEGYTRSGDAEAFENDAPVVQAAFDEEAIASGSNSRVIELSDDAVVVLRVTAHNPPAQLPLETVSDQIRDELERAAAERAVEEAANAFLADLGTAEASAEDTSGGVLDAADSSAERASNTEPGAAGSASVAAPSRELAALAEAHGGVWNEPRWVERTDGNVPTEVLAAAFRVPTPVPTGGAHEVVLLAAGDAAVMQVLAAEAGDPETLPRTQLEQGREQRAQQAAAAEMAGYAADVRDSATVRIPDEVLNPQF